VSIRVLVVDDFEMFRQFVRSMLSDNPEIEVVAEAADGFEAVQKARQLQPDLVVLDIGLPKQSGIEAARQIQRMATPPRILFLTENSSPAIVREALGTGAMGYVVKSDAGREFQPAVEAVVKGKRFVSKRLAGFGFSLDPSDPTAFAPSLSCKMLV
jgi:DNA-binding NarL/FixJ family response regulator